MAFLAGDILTAQRINRLQPKSYPAIKSSGNVAASQSAVDVPGLAQAFTTETNGATVDVWWFVDMLNGTTPPLASVQGSTRAFLDSVTGSDEFTVWTQVTDRGRGQIGNVWTFTVPTAGAHSIKIVATTPANMTINQYSSLKITVNEVV